MTTATINKPNAEWSNLFRDELLGESMENIVDRFVAHDNRRLDAAYKQVVQEHVYQHEMGNDFARAVLIAGDKGPRAVIAEFWAQIAKVNLVQMLDAAEKSLEDDDAPDEPAAPVPTNGHHAQEDAADDEEEDTADADSNSLVDVRHILNSAIPKARAVIAALQMVDGLPLLDNPDNHDGDKGIGAVADMVSATLIRSIDGVIAEMPLAERARMVKLVMEQAGPHVLDFNVDRDEGRPIDTPAVVALLTRSGAEVESLIEALANQTLRDEIEMGITEALGCLFNAMPLDVQARTYKLIHARVTHWRESAARKTGKAGKSP